MSTRSTSPVVANALAARNAKDGVVKGYWDKSRHLIGDVLGSSRELRALASKAAGRKTPEAEVFAKNINEIADIFERAHSRAMNLTVAIFHAFQ